MRHVCLDLHACAPKRTIFVVERHADGRIGTDGWLGWIDDERHAHVTDGIAAATRGHGAEQQRDQTEAGDTFRSHAHVHAGRRAVAGGNMWKYMATTIGRKTIVL